MVRVPTLIIQSIHMQPILSQEYLQFIDEQLKHLDVKLAPFNIIRLNAIWAHLKKSEDRLLQFINNVPEGDIETMEDSEFGLTLYAINHLLLPSHVTFFRTLHLPPSSITPELFENEAEFFGNLKNSGRLGQDGTLYLNIPFGQLDIGWAASGICYVLNQIGIIKTHPFNQTPAVINLPDQQHLKIAIIGDWGTGIWKDGKHLPPNKLIANAINKLSPKPDILLHLGDVYYSGLNSEEHRNFIAEFPNVTDHNFTLNSNHEAYCGSNGYYKTALANNFFKHQKNTSFFAIRFKGWLLVGLDSAYFDRSILIKEGALLDDNLIQQKFVEALKIGNDEKVILFTHHHGMDYTGTEPNGPLLSQVHTVLGNFYPDYWYYGHLHNCIVYNQKSVIGLPKYTTRSATYPKLRCVGNSAIPFGRASGLMNKAGVDYFSNTPIDNPDATQQLRVLNGFAMLTLSAEGIIEEFYDVSPVSGAQLKFKI